MEGKPGPSCAVGEQGRVSGMRLESTEPCCQQPLRVAGLVSVHI